MASHEAPIMSVVLYTPHTLDVLARTLRHLRAQTIAKRLELLVYAPDLARLSVDDERLQGLGLLRLLPAVNIFEARARAVDDASTPLIAYAEDHAYPASDWAAVILAAFEQGYDLVAPQMDNANPATVISWVEFLLPFSPWAASNITREMDHLPGHNTCYRRDTLLDIPFAERKALLMTERVLHFRLHAAGKRMLLSSETQIAHVNCSLLSKSLTHFWLGGRMFGAQRVKEADWKWARCLAQALAWPLVPLLRLRRIHADLKRCQRLEMLPRLLPFMLLALAVHALAEAIGYVFGTVHDPLEYAAIESERVRLITEQDQAMLAEVYG